jgi:hypothetical protein
MFLGLPDSDPDPLVRDMQYASGSGSVSGSFYHHAKIVRKTLIPTVLWLLWDFLSVKNNINVPSKSNKQQNFFLKLVFVADLKVNDEKSRIRIHSSEAWIRASGSGSTPKCHGSGTLLRRYVFWPITYFKYIFPIKIQLSMTLKSDQDPSPDPHGSALVWLPGFGSGSALRLKAGSGSSQHCLCYARQCPVLLVRLKPNFSFSFVARRYKRQKF